MHVREKADPAAAESGGIARWHHSVPKSYLRGWSSDGRYVSAYRLLVPHLKYPVWRNEPVGSLTRYAQLYTTVADGADSDQFEKWLNNEFESPAMEALRRVREDRPLRADDWSRLARFAAALDRRTPWAYLEHIGWMERDIPALMRGSLDRVESAVRGGKLATDTDISGTSEEEPFPLPMNVRIDHDDKGARVTVEVTAGRASWLNSIYGTLSRQANVLAERRWAILRPYRDATWFTSDVPVLRLHFNSEEDYNFGGGWSAERGEIALPLSSRHLLFSPLAKNTLPPDCEATREMTLLIQRFIAERAWRWIIAEGPSKRAAIFRRRRVDLVAFQEEQRQWRSWGIRQAAAEAEYGRQVLSGSRVLPSVSE